jgi:rhamnose transport system permease protein
MTEVLLQPSRMSTGRRLVTTLLRSREIAIVLMLVLVVGAATAKTST